jgi:glyoxylase-like metal-dependent hydrolase (beta-lactamase superfamily II)
VPNIGFDREMTIDLGGTEAQLRFIGRGNTAGDTIVYLPRQKILVTGDLVDHPVPYMFGQIAVDYVDTLDRLLAFDADTIVPGHGDILRDKQYIRDVQAMVRTVNEEVERQVNAGKTLEEAQDIVPKNLATAIDGWHKKFAANAEDATFFDQSFAGLVKSAYNQIRMR